MSVLAVLVVSAAQVSTTKAKNDTASTYLQGLPRAQRDANIS